MGDKVIISLQKFIAPLFLPGKITLLGWLPIKQSVILPQRVFQLKLSQLLSPVCGILSYSAPSTVLLLPNSLVTLSSNIMGNNVNLTHSVSWSLLRRRKEIPQLHFPRKECCLAAASWKRGTLVWSSTFADLQFMPSSVVLL